MFRERNLGNWLSSTSCRRQERPGLTKMDTKCTRFVQKNNATVYSSKHLERLYLGFGVVFFEVKTLSKIRALWIYNTMIFRSKDGFAPWHGILWGSASSAQRPTLCNTSAEQCAPTWSLGSPWSLWDPGVIWLATLLQNSFWQNTCLLGILLVSYA